MPVINTSHNNPIALHRLSLIASTTRIMMAFDDFEAIKSKHNSAFVLSVKTENAVESLQEH